MNKWEYIRKHKEPRAKRGRMVIYSGQPMRMSSTNNGHVVLRQEYIVHPTDPNLHYNTSPEIEAALDLITSGVEMVISNGGSIWDEYEDLDHSKVCDLMCDFIEELKLAYMVLTLNAARMDTTPAASATVESESEAR